MGGGETEGDGVMSKACAYCALGIRQHGGHGGGKWHTVRVRCSARDHVASREALVREGEQIERRQIEISKALRAMNKEKR